MSFANVLIKVKCVFYQNQDFWLQAKGRCNSSLHFKSRKNKHLKYHNIFLLYFVFPQTISVSVSVLTLSCIAQDRWYAICHPLKFKSTAKRARKSIIAIWVVSCIIMIPQAIVMECSSLLPELTNKTSLFTVCDEHWGG